MNFFKFRNVGQGLFYTGSLMHKTYNFVYDCGSIGADNKKLLNKQIEEFVSDIKNTDTKPVIDFVVISHLDRDHYNGLIELASKAIISKLYLPYLPGNKNIKVFILACSLLDIDDLDEGMQLNRELFREFYYALELYNLTDTREFVHNIGTIIHVGGEDYGKDGKFNKHKFRVENYWEFVLLNKIVSGRALINLYERLDAFMKEEDCVDLLRYILEHKSLKKLKEIYEEVFKNDLNLKGENIDKSIVNATSITMLHYPLYKNPTSFFITNSNIKKIYHGLNWRCCFNCLDYCNIHDSDANMTLLTGDIIFDKQFYNELKVLIGGNRLIAFQIPHHGSEKNWDKKNYDFSAVNYVVSFGLGNKHRHPSENVVNAILNANRVLRLVNQMVFFDYTID